MRKSKPKKRNLLPDPKYNDTLVTRFVNDLMLNGKKSVTFSIFYNALDIVGKKMEKNEEKLSALEIWKKALVNVTPQVEVRSRRVGGATFQIPQEIRESRKESLSFKAMIGFAKKRSGRSMSEKLAAEIVAAYNEEGGAFKKKEDTHRMAEANKAFSHFRF
ncbi:MAG: 30S ribosomal protein S7 [Bacteroidales bacterium]|nr:30S ribosomal protein S7 [Bacteroidales bacterium]